MTDKIKKILIVDCWLLALERYELRLAKIFNDINVETNILHFSKYHNIDTPLFQKSGDVIIYDYCYFNDFSLVNIFKKLLPDMVVITSSLSILERIVYDACKTLSIPCICIQHRVNSYELRENLKICNPYKRILMAIPKYLRLIKLWLNVKWNQSWIFLFDKKMWFAIIRLVAKRHKSFSKGFPVDKILVFSERDKKYYMNHCCYRNDQIEIVGNIYFDNQNQTDYSKLVIDGMDTKKPTVLYVAGSFVECGWFSWTEEYAGKYYRKLAEKLNNNYNFIIKLHDVVDSNRVVKHFETENNKPIIIQNVSLDVLCYKSDIVLGHISTGLDFAIRHKKPIVLLPFTGSEYLDEIYHKLYKETCWFVESSSIDDLDKNINILLKDRDYSIYTEKAENAVGYLDGQANKRIQNVIQKVIMHD